MDDASENQDGSIYCDFAQVIVIQAKLEAAETPISRHQLGLITRISSRPKLALTTLCVTPGNYGTDQYLVVPLKIRMGGQHDTVHMPLFAWQPSFQEGVSLEAPDRITTH
jgi:hypothetical protein